MIGSRKELVDMAIEEIDEIRTKKRAEFVRINDAANKVFEGLQPILDSYWVQIEETAMKVIDDYPMSAEDLKRDKLKIVYAKLTERIKENIENKAQLICEQIQNEINIALSDETERLQEFEDEFFESVNKIQEMFMVNKKINRNGGAVDQLIGAAIGATGTGGLFIGFREAGAKGALLGGITGAAGFFASYFPAMFFAGFLGITTGPVVLCLMAFAGLAGTFTGKFTVDKFLTQERIDKFKADFNTRQASSRASKSSSTK